MKSGFIGGIVGSLLGVLLGAAAFRAGTPVDARFTFQGQLRDGDALVSGNVDIRFTLWDAQDGGAEVGTPVTRTNLTVTDGRFATELDFGASAFAGDARWIQMEVRSPAGTGQYLALPRQRVNAVPYALYSLNGGLSPWNLDVATRDIGYVNGRVGIGTNAPTAALEVVSTAGGDDSVKLPTRSVGVAEIDSSAMAQATCWAGEFRWAQGSSASWGDVVTGSFSLSSPATVTFSAAYRGLLDTPVSLIVDGTEVARLSPSNNPNFTAGSPIFASVPLAAGSHSVILRYNLYFPACTTGNCGGFYASGSILAIRTTGAIQ